MAIEYKDYYEILGLQRGAGDDEIRNAFRRLARQYHPDKTGNNRDAEDRFKEINEAYEVLSDPTRRDRYDNFTGAWEAGLTDEEPWKDFARRNEFAASGGRHHFQFDGHGFSQFFDELFGAKGARRGRPRNDAPGSTSPPRERSIDGRGDDLETDILVTLDEVANGVVRTVSTKRAVKCATCLGMGQYNAHPCEACSGSGEHVASEACRVKIPKGIQEGAFLRIPGRGEQGIANGPPGDLYLKIHYAAHPDFRVERGNLIHDLDLAPWEAVLGTTLSVPTLAGPASIKIPAGTQNGAKMRVKGRGLPAADATTGDLILNIRIQVPGSTALSERQLWEELARESMFQPRHN